MTSGKDDEEFFKARGFGVKIGFGDEFLDLLIFHQFDDARGPVGIGHAVGAAWRHARAGDFERKAS
jgi:hypothetical protein